MSILITNLLFVSLFFLWLSRVPKTSIEIPLYFNFEFRTKVTHIQSLDSMAIGLCGYATFWIWRQWLQHIQEKWKTRIRVRMKELLSECGHAIFEKEVKSSEKRKNDEPSEINRVSFSVPNEHCKKVLRDAKETRRKHWEIEIAREWEKEKKEPKK